MKENSHNIFLENHDNEEYVIYAGIGLALKHITDYDISFEDLTPEQLIFIWLEEIDNLDDKNLDDAQRDIIKEIKDILNNDE